MTRSTRPFTTEQRKEAHQRLEALTDAELEAIDKTAKRYLAEAKHNIERLKEFRSLIALVLGWRKATGRPYHTPRPKQIEDVTL
jgi:hypothetical protein